MVFWGTVLHCKAILGREQPGLLWNFIMNHAPGAGLIIKPVDQQSSPIPLCHRCPSPSPPLSYSINITKKRAYIWAHKFYCPAMPYCAILSEGNRCIWDKQSTHMDNFFFNFNSISQPLSTFNATGIILMTYEIFYCIQLQYAINKQ